MKFLHEKQTRIFYLFLVMFCLVQICFSGFFHILKMQDVKKVLVMRELMASSYLLEQEISPVVVAAAWNHTEVTEEGAELIEKIGHAGNSNSYPLFLMEQTLFPDTMMLVAAGFVFSVILLSGSAIFLRRRESMYEHAEMVIDQYAENRFEMHLPAGKDGTIYQLFGSIEQLAMSLQAKSETEHKAKTFLKDMISNISHQIKTPLAALQMYMEIITEEPDNEKTVKSFAAKSVKSLERMEQLIQSLLKMARLDTGSIVFEKRKCLIAELVEESVNDLRERARCEGKEILTEGIVEEKLICDPEWTKEAVGNLVKNALDHTEAGGVIRISWKCSPAVICLTVEDNGCGIAPEDIHHIFRRFYRSSSSGDRQGAGLGLSLAKAIAEGQGGNLSVESMPGEGSVFRFAFLTDM